MRQREGANAETGSNIVKLNAQPDAVVIEPSRTALVVVDMQNAFASKGGMLDLYGIDISGASQVIDVHQRLLPACRTAGIKIIYLQMTYQPDLHDAGDTDSPNYHKELGMVLMRQRPELAGRILVENTWDWQIVDDIKPHPDDKVIAKTRYSGFTNPELDDYLRSEKIQYLLFTGIATNICVESTARAAYFKEYWPILVEDAMNHAGPEFTRQATLWTFENVFGWVTDSKRLLEALKASD